MVPNDLMEPLPEDLGMKWTEPRGVVRFLEERPDYELVPGEPEVIEVADIEPFTSLEARRAEIGQGWAVVGVGYRFAYEVVGVKIDAVSNGIRAWLRRRD